MDMDLDYGIMPVPVSKITGDTITVKGGSALTLGLENDLAKVHSSKVQIWFWTGCDRNQKLFEKLAVEYSLCPLVNSRIHEDISGFLDESNRICLIYITHFFDDDADFLYLVKGYTNMQKFLRSVFSGRAYDYPCFATPLQISSFKKLINTPGLDCTQYELVSKTETKGIRWNFLYKSAIKAWDKLEFNQEKYLALKEKLTKPVLELLSETEEDTDSEEISDDENDYETSSSEEK